MEIDIKLRKNFVNQLTKLDQEYGREFFELNGLDDDQLSLTDFLDNFVKASNVADSSVDANANVGHKDMVTLMSEMSKPHKKLLAMHKIYLEINQKYGFKAANDWLRAEWTKALYMHDFVTASLLPYCYFGKNTVTVKYNEKVYKVTFEQLYDMLYNSCDAEYDELLEADVFYPSSLYVRDLIDGELVWTKVNRLLKHDNERPMNFIKLSNGKSIIVTDNHPMILKEGEKEARDTKVGDLIYTIKNSDFDGSIYKEKFIYRGMGSHKPNMHTTIELTSDLGWLVGFILAEGSIDEYGFNFKQNYGPELTKAINILEDLDIDYKLKEGDKGCQVWTHSNKYSRWIASKFGRMHSDMKQLPPEFIHYNYDFLNGIICGFADGDAAGGIKDFCFRITSSALLNQFSDYLSFRGLFPRTCCPNIPSGIPSSSGIISKLVGYKMSVSLRDTKAQTIFNNSVKFNERYIPRKREGNFENKCYTKQYGYVEVVENVTLNDFVDTVYDITTESGHFICNDILSHNCYAYDLTKLAEEGLFFLEGQNHEPAKHLDTFIDFVKEFISYTSNRTSGACGLPNLIPYMYYFWSRDVKNGSYPRNKTPEEYAKQQIQRFIYAVNQPYVRDGIQSAFTNTSVFDKYYLEALFGGSVFPDGEFMVDELDGIMQFQKWFMEEMSEIRSKNMFTFPVSTMSFLVKEGASEDDPDFFKDDEFARWGIEHNMKWNDSNIFGDTSVNSLSNCCRLKSNIKDMGYFNGIEDLSEHVYKEMYEEYVKEQEKLNTEE